MTFMTSTKEFCVAYTHSNSNIKFKSKNKFKNFLNRTENEK